MGNEPTVDLDRFYAGDREVMTQVYRLHVGRVERAVSRFCRGVDAECVIHDVFLSLLERPELRRQFAGGNLGAWLARIGANRAVDHLRSTRRHTLLDDPRSLEGALEPVEEESGLLHRDQLLHLRRALERFAAKVLPALPAELARIFDLRFVQGLSQADAARQMGVPRTTFIDGERRLMRPLGRFLCRCLGSAQPGC